MEYNPLNLLLIRLFVGFYFSSKTSCTIETDFLHMFNNVFISNPGFRKLYFNCCRMVHKNDAVNRYYPELGKCGFSPAQIPVWKQTVDHHYSFFVIERPTCLINLPLISAIPQSFNSKSLFVPQNLSWENPKYSQCRSYSIIKNIFSVTKVLWPILEW